MQIFQRFLLPLCFCCLSLAMYAQDQDILWEKHIAASAISSTQLSPDEAVAAVFTTDSVFILNMKNGNPITSYSSIKKIEFSRDGAFYAFQKDDSFVVVQTSTSTIITQTQTIGSMQARNIMAFSFDNTRNFLYLGFSDNDDADYRREYMRFYRWNYHEQEISDSLVTYAHFGYKSSASMGANEDYDISAIKFIRLPDTSSIGVLCDYSSFYTSFDPPFYHDSGWEGHGEFFVWNRVEKNITKIIPTGADAIYSLLFSELDSSIIFSGKNYISGISSDDRKGTYRSYREVYPFSGKINLYTYQQRALPYTNQFYSLTPDTNYFAIISSSSIALWDFKRNIVPRHIFEKDSLSPTFRLYFISKTLVLAGIHTPEYAAGIYDMSTDQWIRTYKGGSATAFTANKDLTLFLTGSSSGTLTLWQLKGLDTLPQPSVEAAFSFNDSATFTPIQPVQFFNHSYPLQTYAKFFWDFGDGQHSTEFQPKHLYKQGGSYTVQLVVVNLNEKSDTVLHQVTIQPMSPYIVWREAITKRPINELIYSTAGDSLLLLADSALYIPVQQPMSKQAFPLLPYHRYTHLGGELFANADFTETTRTLTVTIQNIRTNHIVEQYTYQDTSLTYRENLPDFRFWDGTAISMAVSPNGKLLGIRIDEFWIDFLGGEEFDHFIISRTLFIDRNRFPIQLSTSNYIRFKDNNLRTSLIQNAVTPRWQQGGIVLFRGTDLSIYTQEGTLSYFFPSIVSRKVYCSPTDSSLVALDNGIFNLSTGKFVPIALSKASDYKFSLNGKYIIAVYPSTDTCAAIIEIETGQIVFYYQRHWVASTCLAIAPDGKHFATGAEDGSVTLWNIPEKFWSETTVYIPQEHILLQEKTPVTAFPNPIDNNACTFRFSLQQPAPVLLAIRDILGNTVALPLNSTLPIGEYNITWNGRTTTGEIALSGIYFCTIQIGNALQSIPLVLLQH